ncbi:MAG: 4'-phosphopantetheinyl transferase superfamily protein [Clostridia bacterium]
MIALYAADIRLLAPQFNTLISFMDSERLQRVLQFGNTDSGLRCLAAGLLLRHVFGKTENTQFRLNLRGKPYRIDGQPFNLTHTGDYTVLATADATVGVDLERIRPLDFTRVANRYFHPGEVHYLMQSEKTAETFFTLWTLKESYLKAEGSGFAKSPSENCILPEGVDGARFYGDAPYHFKRYHPFPGYCLSVCSLDSNFPETVQLIRFSDEEAAPPR